MSYTYKIWATCMFPSRSKRNMLHYLTRLTYIYLFYFFFGGGGAEGGLFCVFWLILWFCFVFVFLIIVIFFPSKKFITNNLLKRTKSIWFKKMFDEPREVLNGQKCHVIFFFILIREILNFIMHILLLTGVSNFILRKSTKTDRIGNLDRK